MHLTWRADEGTLASFRARAATESLTYPEVGRSMGELPAGYTHGVETVALGTGDAAFAAGAEGLREWVCHRAAGIRVAPSTPPLVPDTVVGQAISIAGVWILAACRIVAVVDEPDRFGFAYGTLRSHPEVGEEAFVVARTGDAVTFTISVFWRPGDPIAKLGGPITHQVQRRATRTYLRGMAEHVARSR